MTTTNRQSIRQAITTRYMGATNFRGSRIKASAERGSIVVSWDSALGGDENHCAAMRALLAKFRKEDGHASNGWGTDDEWYGASIDGANELAWVRVVGITPLRDTASWLLSVAEAFQAGKRDGGTMGSISAAIDHAKLADKSMHGALTEKQEANA